MAAAEAGCDGIVQRLLENGADPNVADEDSWTPLMSAAAAANGPRNRGQGNIYFDACEEVYGYLSDRIHSEGEVFDEQPHLPLAG